jgi:N-acetylglucosaminyl-diphospho-decaprenol L-rhamnosyltransferase
MTSAVDVVVVSYNSRGQLRDCVAPLAGLDGVSVIVVDNASTDGSLESVADLPIVPRRLTENRGFAAGCNQGWRSGASPLVLFLNPDTGIGEPALRRLIAALDGNAGLGAAGPQIRDADGVLDHSQRRFPRLRSTFARALLLHRVLPNAPWADEVVRDPAAYEQAGSPDWVSGAALLIRRTLLEQLDGLDETFFMYCEDADLCRRVWSAGYGVHYEPEATIAHRGGASAPRSSLLPVLAASRIAYARKHGGRVAAVLERAGLGVEALTRTIVARGGRSARAGHLRALRVALLPGRGR